MLPAGPGLPAFLQSALFARDPVGALTRLRRRYGPVFTLRFPTVGPVVVVSSAAAIPELIRSDPGGSHAGAARRAILPQASPRSSFGGDEAQHQVARGRIAPPLSSERVAALSPEIERIAGHHVDGWPRGRPLQVLSRMRTLTEDVFVRLILGVSDERRAQVLVAAVGDLLKTPGNPPMLPPNKDQAPLGPLTDRVVRRRLKPVADLLTKELGGEPGPASAGAETILDHIRSASPALSAKEAVAELAVVLAAAQEPPAIALTWILERLSRDDDARERFDGADAAWRETFFNETLRLRPPALASLRRLTAPVVVEGNELVSGTNVMVPIPLAHLDPAVFERPLEFHPSRFADPPPPTFIPFGGGHRACPGEALARLQMRLVTPIVLSRMRLKFLGSPERPVQRATVMVPHRSGRAIASSA